MPGYGPPSRGGSSARQPSGGGCFTFALLVIAVAIVVICLMSVIF